MAKICESLKKLSAVRRAHTAASREGSTVNVTRKVEGKKVTTQRARTEKERALAANRAAATSARIRERHAQRMERIGRTKRGIAAAAKMATPVKAAPKAKARKTKASKRGKK